MKEFAELLRKRGLLFPRLQKLDLRSFGIKKRVEGYEGVDLKDRHTLIFFIRRKSRFLSKDADDLLGIADTVAKKRQRVYGRKILLLDAPLCSKAKESLLQEGFRVFAL